MLIEEVLEEGPQGITLLYGPAGAGKTTVCLEMLRGRSIYISTSKNFSVERLAKMRPDHKQIIERLVLFEPQELLELERAVEAAVKLSSISDLLVVDSLGALRNAERRQANQALSRMLANLKLSGCPVLMVSDVYDYLSEGGGVAFVGGDMTRLACDTIIELDGKLLRVRKHKLHAGRERNYAIEEGGLHNNRE
jgi:predicted ATP-dependent serine protease